MPTRRSDCHMLLRIVKSISPEFTTAPLGISFTIRLVDGQKVSHEGSGDRSLDQAEDIAQA